MYDTLIVGGGPARLAAALHLAWHDRKVVVLDRGGTPQRGVPEEKKAEPQSLGGRDEGAMRPGLDTG